MATYDSNVPGASSYLLAQAAAKLAYQNALARVNQQRMGVLRQAGYQGDIDPNSGVVSNIRVDPNNPYGQYQETRRSHADASDELLNELADRGIHGGLANQARSRQRFGFGRDDSQLGQALIGNLGDLQQNQNAAKYDYDRALYEAERQAAMDAIANQEFNPADFSGVPIPSYGPDSWEPARGAGERVPEAYQPPPHWDQDTLTQPISDKTKKVVRQLITRKAPIKFNTYAKDVKVGKGKTLAFMKGKGYYAKPKGGKR